MARGFALQYYKFVEQGEEHSGFIVCTNTSTSYAEHAFYHDGLDKILCCAREDEMYKKKKN